MPLWQVSAGMQCTGYSVIQGTEISSFNVRVLDVAAGEATSGGRADPVRGVRAGGRRDRARPRVLGLADLLPGRGRHPACDRRDRGVDQRVRRQGRARDADRGHHRDAGRRARRPSAADRRRRRGRGSRSRAAFERKRPRRGCGPRWRARSRWPRRSPSAVSPAGRAVPGGGQREGRPSRAGRAARAARLVPAADAAAGLRGRDRLLEWRHPHQRGRDGRLRGRRPGVGLRPLARSRGPARAAAPGRLRLPDRQQPQPTRPDRRDVQARRLRARPWHGDV